MTVVTCPVSWFAKDFRQVLIPKQSVKETFRKWKNHQFANLRDPIVEDSTEWLEADVYFVASNVACKLKISLKTYLPKIVFSGKQCFTQ